MSKRQPTLGQVRDVDGARWDVRHRLPTPHGWDVQLGSPRGRSRPAVACILTRKLAKHLRVHHADGYASPDLPISSSTVAVLRKRLVPHAIRDIQAWYEARQGDLGSMTAPEFAAKHGGSSAAADLARRSRLGLWQLRPDGWYRSDPAQAAILGDRPLAETAAELGVATGTVGYLRSKLRREGRI